MPSDLTAVLAAPTVDVVKAGELLGIGRSAAYRAARDGSLPSVKVGGRYRVPTAKLREMLALPPAPPPSAPAVAA